MTMTLKSFLITGFLVVGLIHCGNGAPLTKAEGAPKETPPPNETPIVVKGASINAVYPVDESKDVSLDSEISVEFSAQASAIEIYVEKVSLKGERISLIGELEYLADEKKVLFYLREFLQKNADYEVTVVWKALSSDEVAQEYTWGFSTHYDVVEDAFVYRGGTATVQPDALNPRNTFVGNKIPTKNDPINKIGFGDISQYKLPATSVNSGSVSDPKVPSQPSSSTVNTGNTGTQENAGGVQGPKGDKGIKGDKGLPGFAGPPTNIQSFVSASSSTTVSSSKASKLVWPVCFLSGAEWGGSSGRCSVKEIGNDWVLEAKGGLTTSQNLPITCTMMCMSW